MVDQYLTHKVKKNMKFSFLDLKMMILFICGKILCYMYPSLTKANT